MSDSAIHLTAGIIGEAGSVLSRTRAKLASAEPVLRILNKADPLATLAVMRLMARWDVNGRRRLIEP